MKTKMTLGKRLVISFGAILLVLLALAALCIRTTWTVRAALEPVGRDYLPLMALATDTERNFLNARIQFIYFATIQKEGTEEKGWVRFRQAQEDVAKLQTLVRNSAWLSGLTPGVEELVRSVAAYEPVLQQVMDAARRRDTKGPEYAALLTKWAQLGGKMVDAAGKLNKGAVELTSSAAIESAASLRTTAIVTTTVAAGGVLLGLLLAYFVAHTIGLALRSIASELRSGAKQVDSAAAQVASSSQSLAQGTSEQAASLSATSESTDEITSKSRTNAEKAQAAADVMSTVDQHVKEGNRTLEEMITSMREIEASSGKISKIIQVIEEIAFQTNILALNAAVEAARAGETGMGFAVVADEVRNLAQRSAQAAKDTAQLIEESIAKSHGGSSKLEKVAAVIRAITESSATVKTLVDEVNLGSREQAHGAGQIAKAVSQMDEVTQSMAANAEQSASAGEELAAQAQALDHMVSELQALAGS